MARPERSHADHPRHPARPPPVPRAGHYPADPTTALGVAPHLIRAEVAAMEPVQVGPTRDRSVLGSLVQFVRDLPYHLPVDGWDETTLPFVELQLAQTPCRPAQRGVVGTRSPAAWFRPRDGVVHLAPI